MSKKESDETIVSEPKGTIEQDPATGETRIIPNPVPQSNAEQCKICGQRVTGPLELEEHMKTHEARSYFPR